LSWCAMAAPWYWNPLCRSKYKTRFTSPGPSACSHDASSSSATRASHQDTEIRRLP
jgi:hypothetical protein